MARYIDEELLRELIDFGLDVDFDEVPETKQALLDMIDYQETADVAPVVHAYNKSKDGFLCSACTFGDFGLFNHGGKYTPKYCPNCGARMDEGVE